MPVLVSAPAYGQGGGGVGPLDAIVVLGCRVRVDAAGRVLQGPLARRLDTAAALYVLRGHPRTRVVACGGRRWGHLVEADVMAMELGLRGIPGHAIVRERCSMTTWENARFAIELLRRQGLRVDATAVVTCDWHLARAVEYFRRAGAPVDAVPAATAHVSWRSRLWWRGRERVLTWLLLGCCALVACAQAERRTEVSTEANAPSAMLTDQVAIARAEDSRRARDIPSGAQSSRDVAIRRLASRAIARILDADDGPGLRALGDCDEQVVAWAGYGLGESCKGREDAHVRAIVARLVSLGVRSASSGSLDPRGVLLRALGRCGGEPAEQTLRAWLRRGGDAADAAAYGLGDLASQHGSLSLESANALLEAARPPTSLAAALYPFGRNDLPTSGSLSGRVVAVARAALDKRGPERVFAVRALGRSGASEAAPLLAGVLSSNAFTPAERAEAAHALGRLRGPGQVALAEALASVLHASRGDLVAGDTFGVVQATLDSLAQDAARLAEPVLWDIARKEPPAGVPPSVLRRMSALRCAAAQRLAQGAWDADVLRGCDLGEGEAAEMARLRALGARPLGKTRRTAWEALARSPHLRVREAALEYVPHHPELGDTALSVLVDALSSGASGLVGKAAQVLAAHREGATKPDARVTLALQGALSRTWSADAVETRVALLDAARALQLEAWQDMAHADCKDPNVTVRVHAAKVLSGDYDAGGTSCPEPDAGWQVAPEIDHPLVGSVRVVFDTDVGPLAVRLDPTFAPVAAAHFAALARNGFYTGIAVHRVVPGFVVQFGDRGGDGYGGSGDLLRCETSPVGFGALDVGVALAGRDTGSSQLFVTLAPSPHLDGEYAWVGQAEGDWWSIAEGDVIRAVHVEAQR